MTSINLGAVAEYHAAAEKWESFRAAWFTMHNNRSEALACNAKVAEHRSIRREMLLKIQKQKLEAAA